jgi:hypothetical protein
VIWVAPFAGDVICGVPGALLTGSFGFDELSPQDAKINMNINIIIFKLSKQYFILPPKNIFQLAFYS